MRFEKRAQHENAIFSNFPRPDDMGALNQPGDFIIALSIPCQDSVYTQIDLSDGLFDVLVPEVDQLTGSWCFSSGDPAPPPVPKSSAPPPPPPKSPPPPPSHPSSTHASSSTHSTMLSTPSPISSKTPSSTPQAASTPSSTTSATPTPTPTFNVHPRFPTPSRFLLLGGNDDVAQRPLSKFETLSHLDGTETITVDWDKVVSLEPEQVVQWIRHLHQSQQLQKLDQLMTALGTILRLVGDRPTQWTTYTQTGLPSVLIDIIIEPDTFSQSENEHNNIVYRAKFLYLLRFCVIFASYREDDVDLQCCAELLRRREEFFLAVWNMRSVIRTEPLTRASTKELEACLPPPATSCVLLLVGLGNVLDRGVTPLTMHAVHFLLYRWVYQDEEEIVDNDFDSETLLCSVYEMMHSRLDLVPQFVNEYTADCDANHREHLMDALCCVLQTPGISSKYSISVASICRSLLFFGGDAYTDVQLPEGNGPVPSLFINCEQQLCSAQSLEDSDLPHHLSVLTTTLHTMIKEKHDKVKDDITQQIFLYSRKINIIAVVSIAMLIAVRRQASGTELSGIITLADLSLLCKNPVRDAEFNAFVDNVARIWHDTLKELKEIRPRDQEHAALIKSVIAHWRRIGTALQLREGVKVVTAKGPSVPSEERRHWKIPKRCFRPACVCSGVVPSSCHHKMQQLQVLDQLLMAIGNTMAGNDGVRPVQWTVYAQSGLPDRGSFNSVAYRSKFLFLFNFCLRSAVGKLDEVDLECCKGLLQRREEFFVALWNMRNVVHMEIFTVECVVSLVALGTDVDDITPLTMHATHFLLYHWVYEEDKPVFLGRTRSTLD
ncbi:hypothetical protein EUX98_g3755 [Antrodiella citrinella]|uniref:Uncharacterized protein n=1 Tax=Antrodiella citrinella TaxID=2447956 RepID=A0A4S4MWU4_9APHY|nr:hypothetical protein EUX98_g3755 [Antrodiella citrinella]